MLRGTRTSWQAAKDQTTRFQRDESGSLIIFSLFIFFAMMMFGGIAVDLMLYENKRTHIQNSTDRAVLAAANLNQRVDADIVVQDYLAKVGIDISLDDVSVKETKVDGSEIGETAGVEYTTGREVSVAVAGGFDTVLMNLVGVDSLSYYAASEAAEGFKDVEVSLVLDVSGSMSIGTKMDDMQNAANGFIDDILVGAEDDRVSVSLVPYSTQVSAGPEILSEMTSGDPHDYSHCVNFEDSDFDTTALQRERVATDGSGNWFYETTNGQDTDVDGDGIPDLAGADPTEVFEQDDAGNQIPIMERVPLFQTAHFDPWKGYSGNTTSSMDLQYPVCRGESYFDILPWSNSQDDLKDQINALQPNGNTSIDIAVKWGTALLDPSMRPIQNAIRTNLASTFTIDDSFNVRPHELDYDDVLKFVVVMTDGINTTQYALEDRYKQGMSPFYEIDGEIYAQRDDLLDYLEVDYSAAVSNRPWYNVTRKQRVWNPTDEDNDVVDIDDMTQLPWTGAMAAMPLSRFAYTLYHQTYNANHYYENYYNSSDKDDDALIEVDADAKVDRMGRICTKAKAEGIVIFSIGFEVTDASAAVMKACASSPNHFYRVGADILATDEDYLDIDDAFASIASQINQLRLTQ